MTLTFKHKALEAYPVLWGIPGHCAWCDERLGNGNDASRTPEGEYICGNCADAARKELQRKLEDQEATT